MTLEFGTDGVRGVANVDLTPELVLGLGRAAARVLGGQRWLVGRDTRASGPMLQAALSAGLAGEGSGVIDLGVVPTPAVAFLAERRSMPAAMISASHNPYSDNGIKLFAAGGLKLTDEVEERLESELRSALVSMAPATSGSAAAPISTAPAGKPAVAVGRLAPEPEAVAEYVAHLGAALDGRRLDGMGIVLDCANGAASAVAPAAFSALGAELVVLHAEPDGTNINAGCGSTHPDDLQRAVRQHGADAGLAFDGDADRVVAVDHTGALVDGDHLLAIFAVDLRARGGLAADTVAVTVMTNLGFRQAMAASGITVVETGVGDRYVLEALEDGGLTLGGEQSGHIIFRDVATTGDGLLTGLRALDVVRRSGRTLHDLATSAMTRLPQVLRNVTVGRRDGLASADTVWAEVAAVEAMLGAGGRVLLRPSGTEPVVRVMVEAPTEAEAEAAAERLCAAVIAALGPTA